MGAPLTGAMAWCAAAGIGACWLATLGCGHRQGTQGSDELQALLERARGMGLITSIDEVVAQFKLSPRNSAPLYNFRPQQYVRFEDSIALLDILRGKSTLQDGLDALSKYKWLAARMEEAAALPDYAPQRDWTQPLSVVRDELNAMRDSILFFAARAAVRAAQGDAGDAVEDMLRVSTVIHQMTQEPCGQGIILQRLALRDWRMAGSRVARSLASDVRSMQALSLSARKVDEPPGRVALGHEIAFYRRVLQQVRLGEVSGSALSTSYGGVLGERSESLDPLYAAAAGRAEAMMVGHLVEIAEAWGDRNRVIPLARAFENGLQDDPRDFAKGLVAVLLPPLVLLHEYWLEAVATVRTTRIGLAAALIRARTGGWPTLAEAAKEAGVPERDPFAAGVLRYRAVGKSLIVYSVGADGKDDGGKPKQSRETLFDVAVFEVRLP